MANAKRAKHISNAAEKGNSGIPTKFGDFEYSSTTTS
jgi:hypothetical protein